VLDRTLLAMVQNGIAFRASMKVNYGATRNQVPEPLETEITAYRAACTLAIVYAALKEYHPGRGDPVPVEYGCHATIHAAGFVQYNDANAVTAVMVIVSILREMHESGW